MNKKISFMRLHLTEESAKSMAQTDVDAFKLEFPDAVEEEAVHVLRERYTDYGLIGVIIRVTLKDTFHDYSKVNTWLDIVNTSAQLQGSLHVHS